MAEKVITEAFLRKLFLKVVPETFCLSAGQILTPAAEQFLGDKRVQISTGKLPAAAVADGTAVATEGFVSVADGQHYLVKPEQLTHLIGNQLIRKDHPRIIFRGKLDRFQAELLLVQKQALSYQQPTLCEQLEEVLQRARSIMRADVLGETLTSCDFLGLSEAEIRQRSQQPQHYYGLEHLRLSSAMDYQVLALNRLRTLARSTEIAATSAFAGGVEPERLDIIQALNRLSSVIYVLMLQAAQATPTRGESIDNPRLDEIVARVMAEVSGTTAGIPVELSARHVHLSAADAEKLFGGGLTMVRELSQPGQFLCQERVCLLGPSGRLDNVAVLGPARGQTQVEISLSDARILGVTPPLRQSGDTAGSAGIQIASERATIDLSEGLLVPGRHIHMQPQDALRFGVRDRDYVQVRVGAERALVFEQVLVRVNENYRLAMHVDFDEGNACGWSSGTTGSLMRQQQETTKPVNLRRSVAETDTAVSLLKKLVTEKDILAAHQQGVSALRLYPDVLLTPLASDCAREHGIQLHKTEKVK